MGAVLARVMLPATLRQIRHVTPVRPGAAPDLVRRVYGQVERDFGMLAPPVILHSPAPQVLAACWLTLRESLLARGAVTREVKEAVAAGVSRGNSCPYCVDVHQATMDALVRRGGAPGDGLTARVEEWARTAGRGGQAGSQAVPAPSGQAAELLAVAVTFHYLNRMVNVFLGESPLPPAVPARARKGSMRLFGLVMAPAASKAGTPGDSLDLLPDAPLPPDLSWAGDVPHVALAFARAAAAVEEAGRRSVPEPVRDLVTGTLAGWDGEPPGPSRAWVADAVSGLPDRHRPAGRLALLTALASYQVDDGVVNDFRREEPGDRALVELTAWAAMSAARRAGALAHATGPYAGDRDTATTPTTSSERTAR
ncbi:carboxymuconolactone decarboxylase family protein [Microbispora sp. H11081]|uniref:carboxymuconolactone decarboxylase family protein n=1 Tax=Microbispora sp. H11081 TaxID=2729107 RepID=UPI001473A7E8|nr:carboxymuconolactone decarboxylase family protein [Microbispora sp. H11081]